MNMKLRKVIGDLRVNPGRIILVIFALVIGLWGVGSILVSYTILSRDLNQHFNLGWASGNISDEMIGLCCTSPP